MMIHVHQFARGVPIEEPLLGTSEWLKPLELARSAEDPYVAARLRDWCGGSRSDVDPGDGRDSASCRAAVAVVPARLV